MKYGVVNVRSFFLELDQTLIFAAVGDWAFEAVLHADQDIVDNLWSIMADTLAVHYRRRGLW